MYSLSPSLQIDQLRIITISNLFFNQYSDIDYFDLYLPPGYHINNTGAREGKEIVQLYIGDHESTLERPVKELKGFKKITLAQGETKTVTFEITADMLKYYDPAQSAWVLESGKFTAYVGAASDDIRTDVEFTM